MAGITPEGFERPTVRDLLDEIETDELNTISPLLDVSADQPLGQLNSIVAERLGILYELLETLYHSFDPDAAEGDLLENICKLVGVVRRPASKSKVTVQCELEADTTLLAGTHFVVAESRPDKRFTPVADFTATLGSTATYDVPFEAETTGPVFVDAHELTLISTAVVGWLSADKAQPATVGSVVDDDATLRTRREEALARAGGSTYDAIKADLEALSQDSDGVIAVSSVRILENETDDALDGVPPHSFEVVIYDGGDGSNDDANNLIAQTIWDNRPIGIRAVGTSTGTAVAEDGSHHTVSFTRPTPKDVYITYALETTSDYLGDTAVKAEVAAKCTELFPAGSEVIASHVRSLPFVLEAGIADVTDFAIGFAPSPTNEDNLSVLTREFARFQVGNISIST